MAESTRRPFGKSSSFMSRVVDRKRMRRFKAMRSETVGAKACLASCPTAHCRSGRNTDRNNKRPTCVRKYECSSLSSGVSSTTIFHTSSSTLPRRACQPGILHDILDQLWVDHQPQSIHRSFQHPAQKLHWRLAWFQDLHISQEHGVSHVFRQPSQARPDFTSASGGGVTHSPFFSRRGALRKA